MDLFLKFHFCSKLHSRHQIAKLWWMAEMTEIGKYHKVAGIINTDMINYCLDITAPISMFILSQF